MIHTKGRSLLLTVTILAIVVFGLFLYHAKAHSVPVTPQYKLAVPELSTTDINIPQLLTDTNKDRATAGLSPVVEIPQLDASATDKCNDMITQNYWAHNNPDGRTPWMFINKYVTGDHYAGENLIYGYDSSNTVEQSWMNSPEHRANIMNPNYNFVGFNVCKGEHYQGIIPTLLVVEHFTDTH
jgi:uncharacterized protein YkwD